MKKINRYRLIMVASGILAINKKVLLIKRGPGNFPDPNTWTLPCGRIKTKEHPIQAVVREFKEETNVTIAVKRLVAVESYFYDTKRIRTIMVEFIHEVKAVKPRFRIKLDKQHTEYRFVGLKDLISYSSLVAPRHRATGRICKSL